MPSLQPTSDAERFRVTFLVANWNGKDILQQCLASIYANTHDIPFEIVVVDDASSDDSVNMIQTKFPLVKLVVSPVNLGFVGANNLGVQHAAGTYILLLNSDTVLLNDAASLLAAYMEDHPDVGVCGPALTGSSGLPQVSYGWPPSLLQGLVDALFLNDLFPRAGLPSRAIALPPGKLQPFPVYYINGAALMIRHSLVEQFGLFDKRFRAYCEEVDLCWRIRKTACKQVVLVPTAHIKHYEGQSYGQLGEGRIQILYESYHTFLLKHHGAVYSFITRILYAWHYAVKGVFRGMRYLFANPDQRARRRQGLTQAFYHVRYSLCAHRKM